MKEALKILIIEDEIVTAKNLQEELIDMGYSITDCVRNSEQALLAFRRRIPDLVLIDIHLEGSPLDGIEIARLINNIDEVPIIYLTAFTDQTTKSRAKATKPAYYLIKPWNSTQLEIALDFALFNFVHRKEAKIKQSLSTHTQINQVIHPSKDYFFAKSNTNKYVKVNIDELLYIQAANASSEIITSKGKFVLSANLKSFRQQFSHPQLLRVHRSFIINIAKIEAIQDNFLISEQFSIPIGKTYLDQTNKILTRLKAD